MQEGLQGLAGQGVTVVITDAVDQGATGVIMADSHGAVADEIVDLGMTMMAQTRVLVEVNEGAGAALNGEAEEMTEGKTIATARRNFARCH